MKRQINPITVFTFIFILFAGMISSVQACHSSSLTLNNVTDNGDGTYQIDMTYTCGAGNDNGIWGAQQPTWTYAFYSSGGATFTGYPDSLISPNTGTPYYGFTTQNDTVLAYNSSVYWWACITAGCGPITTVSQAISVTTNGLPETIELIGMEGAGNPAASCTGLVVHPACFGTSVDAGPDETVYYGYQPEACVTMTATASGGSGSWIYSWDGVPGPSLTVCPNTTTTYTVTATDLVTGCIVTDDITVNVIDVVCGSANDRVRMCNNNGQTRCVRADRVTNKLSNGWTLGACGSSKTEFESGGEALAELTLDMRVGPNPFTDVTHIQVDLPANEKVTLEVYDLNGAIVKTIHEGSLQGGGKSFEFRATGLAKGLYVARLTTENGQLITRKLMLQ